MDNQKAVAIATWWQRILIKFLPERVFVSDHLRIHYKRWRDSTYVTRVESNLR